MALTVVPLLEALIDCTARTVWWKELLDFGKLSGQESPHVMLLN